MSEEDQELFAKLPDEITIHRGSNDTTGFSWTLKKEKAKWFANRFGKKEAVTTLKVSKQKVIAYVGDRNEFEIIYIPE